MPNQPTPQKAMSPHSRRVGRTHRPRSTSSASTAEPISSRPTASAPGEKSCPTPRIATNAEAQASSVTATASTVRPPMPGEGLVAGGTAGRVCVLTSGH
jgi:hypothetical protein